MRSCIPFDFTSHTSLGLHVWEFVCELREHVHKIRVLFDVWGSSSQLLGKGSVGSAEDHFISVYGCCTVKYVV